MWLAWVKDHCIGLGSCKLFLSTKEVLLETHVWSPDSVGKKRQQHWDGGASCPLYPQETAASLPLQVTDRWPLLWLGLRGPQTPASASDYPKTFWAMPSWTSCGSPTSLWTNENDKCPRIRIHVHNNSELPTNLPRLRAHMSADSAIPHPLLPRPWGTCRCCQLGSSWHGHCTLNLSQQNLPYIQPTSSLPYKVCNNNKNIRCS